MPVPELRAITRAIVAERAGWTARDNLVARLPDDRRRALLGVVVDEQALASAMAEAPQAPAAPDFAPAVDWRNRNGNHVTPPKDQGGCGSCVSFCCVGLVESMCSIEHGQRPDLSEADSHFCSSHGASCSGWWPNDALGQIRSRGVVAEADFPYSSAFGSGGTPACRNVADRNRKIYKIGSFGALVSATDRKNHLTNVGPCSAVLQVFSDFFTYGSGVYRHVSGGYEGLHCVLVIGYSEAQQCWICKNSWGTGWGDGGYFRIGYGQCQIDTTYPFHWARGVTRPGVNWSGWEGLGGQITSRPQAVSWGPNRIDVFARGLDSAVHHKWWDGSGWRGWESMGGLIHGAPAVSSWASGRLDVFGVGTDHRLHHKWYQGGWSGWESLGGFLTSEPAAVSWGRDRIDVFARGGDNALWHLWWDGTAWRGWESLGGQISTAPGVCSWGPNRIDVFAGGMDHHLWHRWWDGTAWRGWEDLGGIITEAPGAECWGANRIDVFARGTDMHMYHKNWNGSAWSDYADLGGVLGSGVGVSSWGTNRLDTFVMGTDSQMWHKWTL
ncbi:C1 family peptidase [Croceibacterium sp. TMG7-5b_MA50]|uniref:C1 family peptidase n=1 Tax=Croceibacterium sp. TMG7-5b_MA50 TaxID=3121290 RepID=UPI003221DA21